MATVLDEGAARQVPEPQRHEEGPTPFTAATQTHKAPANQAQQRAETQAARPSGVCSWDASVAQHATVSQPDTARQTDHQLTQRKRFTKSALLKTLRKETVSHRDVVKAMYEPTANTTAVTLGAPALKPKDRSRHGSRTAPTRLPPRLPHGSHTAPTRRAAPEHDRTARPAACAHTKALPDLQGLNPRRVGSSKLHTSFRLLRESAPQPPHTVQGSAALEVLARAIRQENKRNYKLKRSKIICLQVVCFTCKNFQRV